MPFGFGQFDFNEVVRLLKSEGPVNFEVARQVASWVAQQDEGEVSPAKSVPAEYGGLLEELTRTAVMHVDQASGLGAALDSRPVILTREQWANEALDGLAPLLTKLAERLTTVNGDAPPAGPDVSPLSEGLGAESAGPFGALGDLGDLGDLSGLLTAMAPLLLGVQAGFMAGHVASLALARHEMPLPLSTTPAVTYIAPNILAFEADWGLPRDELAFYVALHEVAYTAMLDVEWVQERILRLAGDYVGAFEVNTEMVEERFAGLDPMNPETFQGAMGDPAELLGAMRSPAQEHTRLQITRLTSVLEGFTDWLLGEIGPPLIPSFDQIREASHRHRVERGEASRFLEALLGFESPRSDLDLGAAFCRGVVERAGGDGLRRLFEDESRVPTEAELEAPGLWLERIDLPPL